MANLLAKRARAHSGLIRSGMMTPHCGLRSYVHVQNFMMLGFVLPDRTWTMILYGIFWEVLEVTLANMQAAKTVIVWYEPPINSIWDLWFNLLGYRFGEMLLHSWLESNRKERRRQLKEGVHASQQKKKAAKKTE